MESGKKQSDLINKALFNIANAVNTTFDLDALYQSIHAILATVVNVDCFFIAVYDEDKDQISFPYNRDAIDTYEWDVIDNASASTSFTWEVIRSKCPLLLTKEQQYQFVKSRGGSHVGSPSEIWLGVPLIVQKKVIGAMVAQSYDNPDQYDEEDIRIFSTVSDQVAIAIERKQWEEHIKKQELLIRTLFEISSAINTTDDLTALYKTIHESLNRIVNLENFYIAFHDKQADAMTFPYYIDNSGDANPERLTNVSRTTSLTGELIRRGKPMILKKQDQYEIAEKLGGSIIGTPAEMWIGVPLISSNTVFGAMVTQSYEQTTLKEAIKTSEILNSVSEQIALAIERKAAVEDLKKRELQLETLYNISNVTHRAGDIEEMFPKVSEAMSKVMDIMDFTIAIYDKTRNVLTFPYSSDQMIKGLEIENADRSSSLTYQVIKTCETLVINNEDEITGMINDLGGKRYGRPARSWVGVPILVKGECVGAIVTQNYDKPDTFTAEQVELLNLVSEQLASAIERKRAENDLLKAHAELEKRVKQRTLELAKTNEELQAEIAVRKQTEEKLIFAKQHAERANMAKSEFLANMSHELRTPMHHILNYTRMGLERLGKTGNAKLTHYLSQSNSSGRRLMRLLDDLLDISRLESGKMTFEMKKNNVAGIVENVVNQLKFSLNEKQQTSEIVAENVDTVVLCDAYRIEQVFQNLLTNAVKFTPEGRKITVVFEKSQQFSGGDHLKVSVKDQGIGIPADELHSIFDKFTQSSKTKTGAGGTGLGLAICQEIIKGHKGFIWARENPEGGTIVMFSIPVDP